MKNLKKYTNNLIIATGIIMGVLIVSTTMVHAEPLNNGNEKESNKVETVEAELADEWEAEASILRDLALPALPTVQVFDENDQLIYETFAGKDEIESDKKLVKLLLKSDLIMQDEVTSYFKISQ